MESSNKRRRSNTKEKDFIKDGMTTEEIRKIISHIRQYIEKPGVASLDERTEYLKELYPVFMERYPMLFEMCCRATFDNANLNYFLEMREKIVNDQITAEKASEQVGKEWFDKYVDLEKMEKK